MGHTKIHISNLMSSSGVKFGTSGARGLVTDMTDRVCYAYTLGFIQHLEHTGELTSTGPIGIGGDHRSSTDRIMLAVCEAIRHKAHCPQNLGKLPSPALAYWGIKNQTPTAMVTGSHIPDDRNGIKYTKAQGEILKYDEAGISEQTVQIQEELFDSHGMFKSRPKPMDESSEARDLYIRRYLDFFPADCLKGKKLGVYQHSAVGRQILVQIFEGLGAQVFALGWSDKFVPVDTEAIRTKDRMLARQWVEKYDLDTIVSTDGDSDRPMVSDEKGQWLRGDVAGIICARWLGADTVVSPVSCNSAVEKSEYFKRVIRTRIGSPFVIEAMMKAQEHADSIVVGYEANGGFLIQSPIERWKNCLYALPTRDAAIVHLAVLMSSIENNLPISSLVNQLPGRFTYSDRLKHFPPELAHAKLSLMNSGDFQADAAAIEEQFEGQFGKVKTIDATDGIRITFADENVIHLRPSGNAPELRCYTEADSAQHAQQINSAAIKVLESWRT